MVTLSLTAVALAFFAAMFYFFYKKTHNRDTKTYYVPKQGRVSNPDLEFQGESQDEPSSEPSQNTDVPAEENDIDYNS